MPKYTEYCTLPSSQKEDNQQQYTAPTMNCVPFHCLALLVAISVLLTITKAADDHVHYHDHLQVGAATVSVSSSTASSIASSSTATASSSLWVGKEDNSENDNDLVPFRFQLEERFLQESALNEFVEVTSNVQEEVPEPVDSDSSSTNSTAEENEINCHCDVYSTLFEPCGCTILSL